MVTAVCANCTITKWLQNGYKLETNSYKTVTEFWAFCTITKWLQNGDKKLQNGADT
jgi:hypothetical protein